ncbi:16S rRNA (adenine(1518)-N(6)/adenine(1519)-N(6))-dimethyltransferase RsmA [Patescibacteria group bacterium]|nr:16S rRNA (adenine(1518)-N(6)/adenine(1519)-N(6))-dimethyltransferase RsmA [Patescibacteria group bacterium]
MKPKRSLGQNFVLNRGVSQKMAEALGSRPDETVIEIGPGHGELTEELRMENKESRILAIEKDERLIGPLQERFKNDRNIEIIAGDALKLLPSIVSDAKYDMQNTGYGVVGNIPYYITGHLLRILSELDPKPRAIVLLVQKEVAERICARPPHMNLLSASVQFWADPEIFARVGRNNFHPAPKVDSAAVKIVPKNMTAIEPDVFYPFLRGLFKQPRKTILNNLTAGREKSPDREGFRGELGRLGIDPASRPQDLTLNDIEMLAKGANPSKTH